MLYVPVSALFLAVPWDDVWSMIMAFPCHTLFFLFWSLLLFLFAYGGIVVVVIVVVVQNRSDCLAIGNKLQS